MRSSFLLALALLVLPLAAADTERGSGVGMNLGVASVGTWDTYHFSWPGGTVDIRLSSAQPLVFFADYDVILYRAGALDDGSLADGERIAWSMNNGAAAERIHVPLGAAPNYVVAVVPFQTQNEQYTLTTNGGSLAFAADAIGTETKP